MANRRGPQRKSWEFRQRLDALCAENGFDPISNLVELALTAEEASVRVSANKAILDYAYPKLKAIEVETVEPVRVVLVDPNSEILS